MEPNLQAGRATDDTAHAMGSSPRLGDVIVAGEQVSGEALGERSLRAASGLAAMGLSAGGTVALLLRNGLEFIEATLAAQHLGAYAVPINWHGAPPEVAHVVTDCGAAILIADVDLLEAVRDVLPPEVQCLESGAAWARWRDTQPIWKWPPAAETPSMIYTSGTTGRPKGVRRFPASPDQTARIAGIRQRIYSLMPAMRLLMPAPLYHSAPNFLTMTTLRNPGTVVLMHRFDPERVLAEIAAHRITHLFAVPTMFVRMLALPEAGRSYDLSSLRVVLHAGAACPVPVKHALLKWLGPIVQEYYGSTEMGAVTFCDSADWLLRPGTVGRPIAPYHVTVVREDGSAAAAGEDGEIVIQAPGLADFTYHGDPAKREAMCHGQALASGDIGRIDADGYLFIADRKTDMILRGGVNIYPAEIEAELIAIQGVRDCAVVGRPDAELGERVVAFIEREGSAELGADAILSHLTARLARFKLPEDIRFVEALPREASGKMFKRRLRQQLMDEQLARQEPG